jgi:hypothetical protein
VIKNWTVPYPSKSMNIYLYQSIIYGDVVHRLPLNLSHDVRLQKTRVGENCTESPPPSGSTSSRPSLGCGSARSATSPTGAPMSFPLSFAVACKAKESEILVCLTTDRSFLYNELLRLC